MSNIKALRQTKKKTLANKIVITGLKTQIKKTRENPTKENINYLYQKVDSAVAKGKIHKNKGNRIKSKLAKTTKKKSK